MDRYGHCSLVALALGLLLNACGADSKDASANSEGGRAGESGKAGGTKNEPMGGQAAGRGGSSGGAEQAGHAGTPGEAGSSAALGGQAIGQGGSNGGAEQAGHAGTPGEAGSSAALGGASDGPVAGSGPAPNVACGNGVVDRGEECDDGNNRSDDGCTTDCRYGCHTVAECDDKNVCTIDTCAPTAKGWGCKHQADEGYLCEDGNDCTTDDRCTISGECEAGTNACTCKTTADCAGFEDGNLCNGTLTCANGRCELNPATVIVCDTSADTQCRHAICQPTTGVCSVVNETNGKTCDDGLFCTSMGSCNAGTCLGSGNPCADLGCAEGCDESNRRCTTSGISRRCRPAAAACDLPEFCNGVSLDCPTDQRMAAGTACRLAAGTCDLPETCNGVSVTCPTDGLRPLGAVCRDALGVCDEPESCDGATSACPTDVRVVAGSVCRAAAGDCDLADSCDGSSVGCPANALVPSGTECRPKAGDCDLAESCDGAAASCPTDQLVAAGTLCRASAGQCDVAEICTGTTVTCSTDGFQASGTACNDGNACTVSESCNGLGVCGVSSAAAPAVPSPLWPPRGWLTGSVRAAPERLVRRPQFRWIALPSDGCGGVTYDIQLEDSCPAAEYSACTFSSPEQNVVGLTATAWQPDADLAVATEAPVGRRYFWRVRACRSGACSAWSQIRYLDVGRVPNDLDGDGYSEVIAGAPEKNTVGAVLVYKGSALGTPTSPSVELLPPTSDANQRFGSVVGTGDLNADGFADLVVAAPNRPNGTDADVGEIYVYVGSATGPKAAPDKTIAAPLPQVGSLFGQGLGVESDVNGDGTAEIVVGAPGQDDGNTDTGIAYVYLGQTLGVVGSAPWTVANPSHDTSALFGNAIATGDITGDGFADLAIASSGVGRLNVLFGAATQILPQVPGAVLGQFSTIDQPSLQMSGDHEGDGWLNLIAGRYGWCCYAERLHVYNGSATGPVNTLNWDRGNYYNGEFGRTTTNGGDFNGDGRQEIVEGMPSVYWGGPGWVEVGTANLNDFAVGPVTIANPTGYSGGRFGEWVSVRGDVNGDGFSDLVVGAPEQDDVFVYFGSTTGLPATFDVRLLNSGKFGRGMPR